MENIRDLIKQKESRKLELKQELPDSDKLSKTAIAFSNSQGGHLLIGVDDNNQIVGVAEEEIIKFEEILSNTIYDNCYPSIVPEIYSVKIEESYILACYFYPSSQKPHYLKSKGKLKGTFVRVGSSNRLATTEVIDELERQKRHISFDGVINYDLEYSSDKFTNCNKHIEEKFDESPNDVLYEKLKLIGSERGKHYLTNLGIWLADVCNDYFPLLKIECARFKGTTTKVFIDQATFNGDLISSIEDSISFVKRNIKLGATIGDVYREDSWEYPY